MLLFILFLSLPRKLTFVKPIDVFDPKKTPYAPCISRRLKTRKNDEKRDLNHVRLQNSNIASVFRMRYPCSSQLYPHHFVGFLKRADLKSSHNTWKHLHINKHRNDLSTFFRHVQPESETCKIIPVKNKQRSGRPAELMTFSDHVPLVDS